MINFTNYVFSKAAATRILGTEVVNTVPDGQHPVIWCWLPKGQKAVSVPKAKFKEHFAEHRRAQGKDLSPMPGKKNLWHVGKYRVTVHPDRLSCNCRDWQSQSAIGIKRPCCKHCFSVLYQLGYGKLSEYLEARESGLTATNQHNPEDTSQLSSSLSPTLPKLPQWILYWESYGRDRAGNPLEAATTKLNREPTDSEVWELRKNAHSKGYKLASVEQVKQTA